MTHLGSLLLGLGNGGVYAALGLALVLTFRSSGVINFATGAIALYGAYTYAGLRAGQLLILIPGLPTTLDLGSRLQLAPAMAIALCLTALLGALLYLVVFRPLRTAPPLAQAVASLGVLVVLQGLLANRVGTAPVTVAPIFDTRRWSIGSATLLSDRFFLAAAVVGMTLVLAAVYRFTRFGLLTRAAAESETGAMVSGVSTTRTALANWMISAAVAGAAGILIAPLSPLTPITYTLLVVPALAAAVVGGFRSVLPTVAAGFLIGMLQSEAVALAGSHSWLPRTGAAELVPLVVILVALLVTRTAPTPRGTLLRQPVGSAPRPRRITLTAAAGLLVGVGALLLTSGNWRGALITTFVLAVIGLSLVVVTGYAGQVSLAQVTLAGTAAFTLSGLTQSWNVPFPLAPLLAATVAMVIGVLIGLPALRLRGMMLGVVTLAFAFAIEAVWFRNTQIVPVNGARVASPTFFGLDLGIGTGEDYPRLAFGIVCLGVLVAVASGVAVLRRSKLGSAMLAVRANERSAAGIGVNVTSVKIASFAISSFIAGLGGALLAYRDGTVTFESYATLLNLSLLSTVYLAGATSVLGGVISGILATGGLLFFTLDRWVDLGGWFPVISGVLLIVTVIFHPEGIASVGHRLAARFRPATLGPGPDVEPPERSAIAPEPAETDLEPVLDVQGLTVRYGGVAAVSGVSLLVRPGEIVGLIGPNGAGKSSVIDAITGFVRSEGLVQLSGDRLNGTPPHQRVRRGMARTFQSLELYDDLTVGENVSAAAIGSGAYTDSSQVRRPLQLVGIENLVERTAGDLSQGERQLVSIARACASEPKMLLLDEPAAGLDTSETEWLGSRLRDIASSGVGVLLVDHDVSLVLSVCTRVYVLDFGGVIAEGDSASIRNDPVVAKAYLGVRIELLPEPAGPDAVGAE